MKKENSDQIASSNVDYLVGPFSRELNYKLWSTKGARFVASNRLKAKATASLWALSLMSFYLIIFSIIPFFIPPDRLPVSNEMLALLNVSLSIFMLMVSQMLNRSDYIENSKRFHSCALRIARLYNDLRIAKTMEDEQIHCSEVKRISDSYEDILDEYDNHDPVDFSMFRASKPEYDGHKIGSFQIVISKIQYYISTFLFYHCLIFVPLSLIAYILVFASPGP